MLKSRVSSYLINIYRQRKLLENINLQTDLDSDYNYDLIDILEQQLLDTDNLNLSKNKRALENKDDNDSTQENKISIVGKIEKQVINYAGYNRYKYLFFKVDYGENGQKSRIGKSDGTKIRIGLPDFQYREFYVFLAYPCDSEAKRGVLILENRV